MLNLKISLILFLAVFAMVAGGLFVNNGYYGERIESDTIQDLNRAREVVVRSKALDTYGQLAVTNRVSAWPNFAEKLQKRYAEGIEGQDERHQLVWEELNVWAAKLKAERAQIGKKTDLLEDKRPLVPDEMFVVDTTGAVVARWTNFHWWGNNIAKELPVVLKVGETRKAAWDLWNSDDLGMMEVTVAPIFVSRTDPVTKATQEVFIGSVIMGFKISDREAERLKALTGVDVAFFYGTQVTAGTIGSHMLTALQHEIVEKTAIWHTGRLSPEQVQIIQGKEYRMTAGLFGDGHHKSAAGFVLLLDRKARLADVSALNTYIPIFGVVLYLLLVALSGFAVRSFLKPFEELDQGIHEFINGNLDYTFPTSDRETLAGNMGHSLNLMVYALLGKPLPEDDESTTPTDAGAVERWQDPLFIDEVGKVRKHPGGKKKPEMVGLPTNLAPPQAKPEPKAEQRRPGSTDSGPIEPGLRTQELVIEPMDKYYQRLYREYLDSRERNGEGTEGITFELFVERLKKTEADLKQKHGYRMVRFRVQTKDGRTTLKPIPFS